MRCYYLLIFNNLEIQSNGRIGSDFGFHFRGLEVILRQRIAEVQLCFRRIAEERPEPARPAEILFVDRIVVLAVIGGGRSGRGTVVSSLVAELAVLLLLGVLDVQRGKDILSSLVSALLSRELAGLLAAVVTGFLASGLLAIVLLRLMAGFLARLLLQFPLHALDHLLHPSNLLVLLDGSLEFVRAIVRAVLRLFDILLALLCEDRRDEERRKQ